MRFEIVLVVRFRGQESAMSKGKKSFGSGIKY